MLVPRPGGELQIGVDPPWLLADPTGAWCRLLTRMDGRNTVGEIVADTDPPLRRRFATVLSSLVNAGLVEVLDAAPVRSRRGGHRIRLVGAGPVAVAVADRLLQNGIERVYLCETADPERAEAFQTARPDRVRLVRHWRKPESPRLPLTLVVADTLEPDRLVTADLLRHDAAHLVVRPRLGGALVGPLVVPGVTACLHCCDLTRRDADPDWPAVLAGLQLDHATYTAPATDWTVAMTVVQVLGFLAGHRTETYGATLELAGFAMAWRRWPAHPECGCRWPDSLPIGAAS